MRPVLFLLLLLPWSAAFGQQNTYSPSHRKAAEELLVIAKIDQQLVQFPLMYVNTLSESNPGLVPYKDIMTDFFQKHLNYEKLKTSFIDIYAESFTEKELKELIAFYNTPTGKKALEQMPVLMQKGMNIGRSIFEANQEEFRLLIEQRAAELNSTGTID